MASPPERERSSQTVIVGVEVHVYRGQNPSQRVRLKRSPATIGRDPTADIMLDSGHVSRIHSRLFFDANGMRLVDAGSTNGFSIQGRRLREALVTSGDIVTLCDFELRFRPLFDRAEMVPNDLAPGWAEYDDDEEDGADPDTGVRHKPEAPVAPQRLGADPTIPAETPLPDAATSAPPPPIASEAGTSIDEEEEDEEENRVPDLPPLLETLRNEANALLYTEPHAVVDVEVIHTVGDQIYDVSLLAPTESCWWGGQPRGLEHLWLMPATSRFPMVTHIRPGEFWVHVPDGGQWTMAHRGQRAVDVHRAGPLLGCRAEYDDQIEVSFGAFIHYVRCVRRPPRALRSSSSRPWQTSSVWLALAASFVLHALVLAIPGSRLPPLRFGPGHRAGSRFATYVAPPSSLNAVPAPPPAPVVEVPLAPKPAPDAKPAPRRTTRPHPKTVSEQPTDGDSREPVLASVSVADFKVSNMVEHLPTVKLPANSSSTLRGGASLLRGGVGLPKGIVGKGGAFRTTPQGRLPDSAVKRVVAEHAVEIEQCYQRIVDTGDSGRVEVEWVVDRIGVVGQVRIIYDEVHAELLKDCLKAVIKRWVFPPPRGGSAVVTFPFVFANLRR